MLKKSPFIAGIALLAQGFSFLVFFILLITDQKKKRIPYSALSVACGCTLLGTLLTCVQLRDEMNNDSMARAIEKLSALSEGEEHTRLPKERPIIPIDDTVNEDEFR